MTIRAAITGLLLTLAATAATADTAVIKLERADIGPIEYSIGLNTIDADIADELWHLCRDRYPVPPTQDEAKLPAGIDSIKPLYNDRGFVVRGSSAAIEELKKTIASLDVTPSYVMIIDDEIELRDSDIASLGLPSGVGKPPFLMALDDSPATKDKVLRIIYSQPGRTENRPIATTMFGQPAKLRVWLNGPQAVIYALVKSNPDSTLSIDLRAVEWDEADKCKRPLPLLSVQRRVQYGGNKSQSPLQSSVCLAVLGVPTGKATLIPLKFRPLEVRPGTLDPAPSALPD